MKVYQHYPSMMKAWFSVPPNKITACEHFVPDRRVVMKKIKKALTCPQHTPQLCQTG